MATTYDKASLVMIPSGVKESKLYSIKPTDGSGDFTFSRGTDTATRVNASGLIEKERENLLYHSNNFTYTWTNTRTTEASGYAGYDGTNDAWALIGTAVDSTHLIVQNVTLTASVVTFSVYVKAGAKDYCILRLDDGTPDYAYFDLSTGTKGTISVDYIDSTITSVGSGWYRVSVTKLATAGTNVAVIYPAEFDNDPTYLGDGVTEDLYMQNSQINYGLVPQEYVDSPSSSSVSEGITDNLPRLDYSGGASCPSLLLEPSRTNLVPYSEYFNASGWNQIRATITDNVAISPEGVQNAAKIVSTAVNNSHYIRRDVASTTGVCYVFAKADDFTFLKLATNAHSFSPTFFNLTTGEITPSALYDADIEEYENGWWKCIIKPTDAFTQFFVENAGDSASASHLGDGVKGVFIYGAQVEAGSYPTSYIPTYGTSASRAGDSCSKTGISSLIGQTEGTLFIEMKDLVWRSSASRIIGISDGTQQNRVILLTGQTSNTLRAIVTTGNVLQTSTTASATFGNVKLAIAYSSAGGVVYSNGSQILSFGAISVPACSALYIEMVEDGTLFPADGKNTQALLFKTRLTDAELAALTTL